MLISGYRTSLAALALLASALTGCSEGKKAPSPPAKAPSETATAAPVPTYAAEKTKSALLDAEDLGKKWTEEGLPDAFKEGMVRGCSDSKIALVGSPRIWAQKFGAPRFRFEGVNYAQLVAVHPTADQATASMDRIRETLAKCPAAKKIPQKKLPDDRFAYQHDDTWKMTEGDVLGWRHVRGFEKSVYPPSLSRINVFYYSLDYAQRGNIVFSSMYWQRVKQKESGDPIAEKATEILTEQLQRFG